MPFAAPSSEASGCWAQRQPAQPLACWAELLMQVRLPVLHPLVQVTRSSAHPCCPSSSGRQETSPPAQLLWRKTYNLSFYCGSSSGTFFPLHFCTFPALGLPTRNTESFVLHGGAQPKPSPLRAGQDMPDVLLLQFPTHEDQVDFVSPGQSSTIVSPWCASVLQMCRSFTVSSPVEVKKPPWWANPVRNMVRTFI